MKKFDFVIGNPPYQEEAKEGTIQAKPVYHNFVREAKKLVNESVIMITPARWFSGGIGLDNYREEMLESKQITTLIEYTNAKECFPNTSISGGVCIFNWKKDYNGDCNFINIANGKQKSMYRSLGEYPVLIRDNDAVSIIHKVGSQPFQPLSDLVSAISPFAISTKVRGTSTKKNETDVKLYASSGTSFLPLEDVTKGINYIDKYSVMVSQTSAEHAGEPSKDGMFRVLTSSMQVLQPGEVCTHSYILIGEYDSVVPASNLLKYLQTRFVRFLILQAIASIHISRTTFLFVPMQDFTNNSDINWTDDILDIETQLYTKYNISEEEIDFINSRIKEMK